MSGASSRSRLGTSAVVAAAVCNCLLLVASVSALSTSNVGTASPTAPQIGNGYVATFVNNSDVFIAGVFNGVTSSSQRAPFRATTRVFPKSCAVAPTPTEFTLDSRRGRVDYACHGVSGIASGNLSWYAHRTRTHLLVQTLSFEATASSSAPTPISLTNFGSDGDSSSDYNSATTLLNTYSTNLVVFPAPGSSSAFNGGVTFSNPSIPADAPATTDVPFTVNATVSLYQTNAIEETAFYGNVTVCEVSTLAPSSITLLGARGTLFVLTSYCTTAPFDHPTFHLRGDDWRQQVADNEAVCGCAVQRLESAIADFASLTSSHEAAWEKLWESGLTVDMLPNATEVADLNDAVVGSLYGLLTSLHGDVPYSTSPGGLPTNGYRGHTFWDMETWMFPNLALFYPDIAYGSAIRYRLDRMNGAKNNAYTVVGGAEGTAAFPWESAFSGYDVCPWPQGEHSEIHITADVVLAWRLYYYVTLNTTFLAEAFPLLNATANFWLSRCTKDVTTGLWDLNGVTPPDEYHFGNNSVYTNAVVKQAVNFTLLAADLLGLQLPVEYRSQLGDLVENLVILYDVAANYHPEFAGYNGTTIVKQADVILLNFPVGYQPLNDSTAANDLLYYQTRTDPGGPAMTWSMFAVGYLSFPPNVVENATEQGFYYLGRGYQQNTFPPYYQWYEVAGGSGCPNFLTGAGGFLQSIWAGLIQLRIVGPGRLLVLSTAILPTSVNATTASGVHLAGSVLNITLSRAPSSQQQQQNQQLVVNPRGTYQLTVLLTKQSSQFLVTANGLPLRVGASVVFDLSSDVSIQTEPFGP